MRLLPLSFSAHATASSPQGLPHAPWGAAGSGSCQFCGFGRRDWQEPFHVNGDHTDFSPPNVVSSCILCHLLQHLDRETIDEEAALIFMPELTQAVVNSLARAVHAQLVRNGEPPTLIRPSLAHRIEVRNALSASLALRERAQPAAAILGAHSPRDLCAALLRCKPEFYERRSKLLAGLRLLPLGRYFRDGEDIYPSLLAGLP
jgi:hypothetical protein